MAVESVKVGNVVMSEDGRIDFLERQVVNLTNRIKLIEEEVRKLKSDLKK